MNNYTFSNLMLCRFLQSQRYITSGYGLPSYCKSIPRWFHCFGQSIFYCIFSCIFFELPPRHCLSEAREASDKIVETIHLGTRDSFQSFSGCRFDTSQELGGQSIFLRPRLFLAATWSLWGHKVLQNYKDQSLSIGRHGGYWCCRYGFCSKIQSQNYCFELPHLFRMCRQGLKRC